MQKRLAEKWVKALRSGDYKQGQNFLRARRDEWNWGEIESGEEPYEVCSEIRYCCLGVLYEVAKGKKPPSSKGTFGKRLLEEVGMSDEIQYRLIQYNDSGNWSFTRIANWIEKNYQKLGGENGTRAGKVSKKAS